MVVTRSSRRGLESLPTELFLNIAEHAKFNDRLALSATNSSCRALLLPIIFRTLKITSDEDESNAILAFAKKIGGSVQALAFQGTAGPNYNVDSDEENKDTQDLSEEEQKFQRLRDQEQILPSAAGELLSGKHFPNMTTIFVHFDFDFDSRDGVWDSRDDLSEGASMYVFTVEETSKDMIDESEAEFPWRRLMAQTWTSVSENKNITKLVVKDLIAKAVSPWFSPQWEQFLAQLSTVDLQMWGGDNGAGWEVGTLEGYNYFLSQLDQYFFKFMQNTTQLRFCSYEHGPLGAQSMLGGIETFSLRPTCFPQLEDLRLEYALICPDLVTFLNSKVGTLRSVALHECFLSAEYDQQFKWADFFTAMLKAGVKWTHFDVTNNAVPPLTFREWQNSKYGKDKETQSPDDEETEDVQKIRAELASTPNAKLFMYAMITDKYGDRWPAHDDIMENFDAGNDMKTYESLMSLVRKNGEA